MTVRYAGELHCQGPSVYDGHAVAAVAAVDAETARKALKKIKVQYKKLPHVTDVDEAMQPGAPIVQPRIKDAETGLPTNVCGMTPFGHGDVEAGFAEADIVIERSYKTEQTHQSRGGPVAGDLRAERLVERRRRRRLGRRPSRGWCWRSSG